MVSREDALKVLMETQGEKQDNLPESLQENTIKAEPLLFKEAQVNYAKRRKAIQRQIVIDNFHFCTQQKILKYAKPDERS